MGFLFEDLKKSKEGKTWRSISQEFSFEAHKNE